MTRVIIKAINGFSSLMCPACDLHLEPYYVNDLAVFQKTPSYYYCKAISSAYGNTPHYKFFNDDGCGYDVFLLWLGTSGDFYSVKRTLDGDTISKVELTYNLNKYDAPSGRRQSVTRTFSAEDFEVNPKDLKGLEERIAKFVEISEVFK